MIERIVIPLDGSSRAERVIPQALQVFFHPGLEVSLLVVVDMGGRSEGGLLPITCSGHEAKLYLGDLVRRHLREGLRMTGEVRFGDATERILRHAEEARADLIAMATHGRTGLARLVRGSVAEAVLRKATVPLFLLPSAGAGAFEPGAGMRILVPLDGSAGSESILPYVRWIAARTRGLVELLRVAEWSPPAALAPHAHVQAEAWTMGAESYSRRVAEALREEGIEAQPLVLHGGAAERILEQAETGGFHLVAMSTHGYSGVRRMVFGSVAEQVLRSARVPLLVVRAQAPARTATGAEGPPMGQAG